MAVRFAVVTIIFLCTAGCVVHQREGLGMTEARLRQRPKLLVLTDIGGDPDDQQSMVRLMAHSNEFEIVGLIATSRMGHGQDTKPEYIREVIAAYGQSLPNLTRHAAGYPTAGELLAVVRAGTPVFDPENLDRVFGPGKSTPASEHIVRVVDAATDGRPVNICIWGGAADLAQALDDVRRTRNGEAVNRFISRMRVYACEDQDGSGAWINRHFPTLRYLLSQNQIVNGTRIGQSGVTRGMYQNDVRKDDNGPYRQLVPDEQLGLTSRAWVDQYIKGHGPLGDVYPVAADQRYPGIWQGPAEGDLYPHNSAATGLKEGDTPTWLFFLPNGLNVPDHPAFGGWGGRFRQPRAESGLQLVAPDRHPSGHRDVALGSAWTVGRWRDAYQREFAARMDWATAATRGEANHPPVSPLSGPFQYTEMRVRSDEEIELTANEWTDPDGDPLAYKWWHYADASTTGVTPNLRATTSSRLRFRVPKAPARSEVHIVLEVTDQPREGLIPMTRYQRFVLTIGR